MANTCFKYLPCEYAFPEISTCGNYAFRCSNGQCIAYDWRCDGGRSCNDGTDEDDCGIDGLKETLDIKLII